MRGGGYPQSVCLRSKAADSGIKEFSAAGGKDLKMICVGGVAADPSRPRADPNILPVTVEKGNVAVDQAESFFGDIADIDFFTQKTIQIRLPGREPRGDDLFEEIASSEFVFFLEESLAGFEKKRVPYGGRPGEGVGRGEEKNQEGEEEIKDRLSQILVVPCPFYLKIRFF